MKPQINPFIKHLVIIFPAAVFFILIAVNSFGTLEILSNSSFKNPVMAEVPFDHDGHNETAGLDDCAICHHVFEDGVITSESSEDMPCADCHDPSEQRNGLNLSAAYHGLCKNCHLKESKGPVVCGECHIKQ